MSKSIEQHLEDAIRHYRAAQYQEGLTACNNAVQLDPKCARAYHGRGLIFVQQKKYEEAFDDYQKSCQLEPKNAKLHADIGELLYILNDYEKSRLSYNEAIQLDRRYEAVYQRKTREFVDKALNLNNRGLQNEAITSLQQGLHFNPANERATSILSTLQVKYTPKTKSSSDSSSLDYYPSGNNFPFS